VERHRFADGVAGNDPDSLSVGAWLQEVFAAGGADIESWIISCDTIRESVSFHAPLRSTACDSSRRSTLVAHAETATKRAQR